MSDKRFTFGAVSPNVAMIKDNGEPMDIGEVVDKLNELSEENEQLNKKLKSVTMLKDDYEELIESFEKKYGRNIEDVIDV